MASKAKLPLAEVKARALDTAPPLDFKSAITRKGRSIRLIAELKKASPSKGLIRPDFDPARIARAYARRAHALSVLTEEDFFQGDLRFIRDAKTASGLPALRKDFIFDPYQIYEARSAGADAVLLISSALDGTQAGELLGLAKELGMSVLFEVHHTDELGMALDIGADIIGINNRDLGTLKVNIETTFDLLRDMPNGKTVVSESGIRTRQDVIRLGEAGVDAMLIGTAFMESADISAKMDELMGANG